MPRFRSARGGATLAVAVARRRGGVGRLAPLPDGGRAPLDAPPDERAAAGRAAVWDLAAAGRAAGRAVVRDVSVVRLVPVVRAFAVRAAVAPRPVEVGAAGLRPAPFVVGPACFFGAALLAGFLLAGFFGAGLPAGFGVVPFALFEPAPVRGACGGRAPEPRAEPEGRAGRREEGMRRLCRFAGPLYWHYLRRAACRTCGTWKIRPRDTAEVERLSAIRTEQPVHRADRRSTSAA